MKTALALLLLLTVGAGMQRAHAFCGFYVAKADAKLFNKSSQVIVARDGNHTVITMSSDYQGDTKDFAMVVPVPEVLKESDIRVVQQYIFDKFDAYTAPRMVEYWDTNPCGYYPTTTEMATYKAIPTSRAAEKDDDMDLSNRDLGVTIKAKYTVGEYDILILDAKQSSGLKIWLTQNGYKIPEGAEEVLDPYIKDDMKFFVVKVNLDKQKELGVQTLRPLQIQFNSSRFMLPIRLGMANAEGAQDMIVYTFTKKGRVETANYRTTLLPTDREIPEFVMSDNLFGDFYKACFEKAWKNEGQNNVMLEYAWDVSSTQGVKCDPCPTPPMTFAEMREAGVWWVSPDQWNGSYVGDLFVTRLHVRYARSTFPQDLMFVNTPNQSNFQGRYVVRHAAQGYIDCEQAKQYKAELRMRRQKELMELAALTGWSTSKWQSYLGANITPDPVTPEPPVLRDTQPLPVRTSMGWIDPTPTLPMQTKLMAVDSQLQGRTTTAANLTTDMDTATGIVDEASSIAQSNAFLKSAIDAPKPFIKRPTILFTIAGIALACGMVIRFAGRKSKPKT
ncbi:MAG: DUF2330 domain-containing protein [Bacteroidia bacterium]